MKTTSSTTFAAGLALAGNAAAFWRMPCRSHTGIARMDPLVAPGSVADHSHIIFGGGNFGVDTTFADLAQCTGELNCTSCGVYEDQSAYWTPPLYFKHQNGTVEMVPNVGGMLAYYLFYLDDLEPFPEGFAMIAGDTSYRNFTGPFPDADLSSWPTDPSDQFFLEQRAIGFNCLNYQRDPEASLYRHQFPEKSYMDDNCADGIRMEMAFPSCGKRGVLDSPDHRSHVAYPSLVKEGNCPEGFDVHYPFLFYETIYATQNFAGMPGEFLVSTGDPVGASYHADFIMGWKSADFLGQAIETCTNPSGQVEDCPLFHLQTDADAAQCKFPMPEQFESDDCAGPRDGLPIGVPIQYGPEPATKYPVPGREGVATTAVPNTKAPATYTQSAPGYSPANPENTKTAEAGIIQGAAAAASDVLGYGSKSTSTSTSSSSSQITQAPSHSSASHSDHVYSTSYITKGNEVIEVVIEEIEVTVTATAEVTPSARGYAAPAAPAYDSKHKRHLEKHQHQHRHVRR